jgi:crotonobetainyl-CoA:carnitine CoA-transferase CaiB-like acyl-CoA transferase
LSKVATGKPYLPQSNTAGRATKCLEGLRVVEMSRVIAAPVAGKTLAAYGAVSLSS